MPRIALVPLLFAAAGCTTIVGEIDGTEVKRVSCDGSFTTDATIRNIGGTAETFTFQSIVWSGIAAGITTSANEVALEPGRATSVEVRGRLQDPCVSGIFSLDAVAAGGGEVVNALIKVAAAPCKTEVSTSRPPGRTGHSRTACSRPAARPPARTWSAPIRSRT